MARRWRPPVVPSCVDGVFAEAWDVALCRRLQNR
jgi:hypothetical protein